MARAWPLQRCCCENTPPSPPRAHQPGAPAPPGAAAAAASKLPPKIKSAEQLSPEELEQALPSMFFTTSNLVRSQLAIQSVDQPTMVT